MCMISLFEETSIICVKYNKVEKWNEETKLLEIERVRGWNLKKINQGGIFCIRFLKCKKYLIVNFTKINLISTLANIHTYRYI
jgi:hypothetical protein